MQNLQFIQQQPAVEPAFVDIGAEMFGKGDADKSAAEVLNDREIVEKAHLKETSLFHLAALCGIADSEEFTRRFIARDREVRV